MTRLTLVRHGQTEWNVARRVQGTSDIPLNETGRAQARAAGRLLAERRWDAIAASPLSRASETASIMAEVIGLAAPETLPGVEERCYGEAEGMTSAQLRLQHPGGMEASVIQGLEKREQVVARASEALLGLADRLPGAAVLVATHGAVIGSLLRHLTEERIPPLGVTVGNGSAHDFIVEEGSLRLVCFDGSGDVVVSTVDLTAGATAP